MENTPPPVPPALNQPPAIPPSPSTDNSLAVVMQLLGFAGFIFPCVGNILAPLILWVTQRDRNPQINKVGKEVLNFQISFTAYFLLALLGCFVGTFLMAFIIGFLILPFCLLLALAISIVWIVFMVVAAVKTSNGEEYKYPFTIRLLQ